MSTAQLNFGFAWWKSRSDRLHVCIYSFTTDLKHRPSINPTSMLRVQTSNISRWAHDVQAPQKSSIKLEKTEVCSSTGINVILKSSKTISIKQPKLWYIPFPAHSWFRKESFHYIDVMKTCPTCLMCFHLNQNSVQFTFIFHI